MNMKELRAGGALGPDDVYIERPADAELFEALRSGELCHVIASSRTGKTSLALRALRSLAADGFRTAYVDITPAVEAAKGHSEAAGRARFYDELAVRIRQELKLEAAPGEECLDPAGWQQLLRRVRELDAPVALALDETNSLLQLPETIREGFLAMFKAFDADRARSGRSTAGICLLGYASPQALMKSPELTPFNASKPILLDDFTLDQLVFAFGADVTGAEVSRKLLEEVYRWTSGHPYMTASLINTALTRELSPMEALEELISQLAKEAFLTVELSREPVLDFAVKQLQAGGPALELQRLEVYGAILREGELDPSKVNQGYATDLQLAGLVRSGGMPPRLVARNRILEKRFDLSWTDKQKAEAKRPFAVTMKRWKESGENDSKLLTLAEIQEETAHGTLWELSREEIQFLGRSVAKRTEEIRFYVRLLVLAIGTMFILIAVAVYTTTDAREARIAARIAQNDAKKAAMQTSSAIESALQETQQIQELVGRCLSNDADARMRLSKVAEGLQNQQQLEAVKAIDLAITYLEGTNADDLARALRKPRTDLRNYQALLPQCRTDLNTSITERDDCRTNLTTRTTERDAYQASLTTRTTERDACQASLTTRTTERDACQASLTTRTTERDACQASLTTRTTERDACQASLATVKNSLTTCQTSLATVQSSLTTCQTSLTTVQSSLDAQTSACTHICAATPRPDGCPCP
ncbi:AAA-like domain-containing protein [Sorangium sp. So ce296]|uniref:AAA-like domain-containing protein n=1 Tax=Sorangium sp. So ce296 TaxID=3133296 RepID=UPI003F635145